MHLLQIVIGFQLLSKKNWTYMYDERRIFINNTDFNLGITCHKNTHVTTIFFRREGDCITDVYIYIFSMQLYWKCSIFESTTKNEIIDMILLLTRKLGYWKLDRIIGLLGCSRYTRLDTKRLYYRPLFWISTVDWLHFGRYIVFGLLIYPASHPAR